MGKSTRVNSPPHENKNIMKIIPNMIVYSMISPEEGIAPSKLQHHLITNHLQNEATSK